jgi:hypothetical protein
MGRKKTGVGRGRRDHFVGVKREFLDSYAATFQLAQGSSTVGEFYNLIARKFIAKYGDELDMHAELAEDPPDPEDFNPNDEQGLTCPEEAAAHSENYNRIRAVSMSLFRL